MINAFYYIIVVMLNHQGEQELVNLIVLVINYYIYMFSILTLK